MVYYLMVKGNPSKFHFFYEIWDRKTSTSPNSQKQTGLENGPSSFHFTLYYRVSGTKKKREWYQIFLDNKSVSY